MQATDAVAWSEAEIEQSARQARSAFSAQRLDADGAVALEELVTLAVDRAA